MKSSFFQRLTGGGFYDDEEELEIETPEETTEESVSEETYTAEDEGQLSVDVYQTSESIVIEAMVAAVKPEDLDVSITREVVTIKGRRDNNQHIDDEHYFARELYWGAFSRTIVLPQEIEPEGSDAKIRNGLITITLPKIDKDRAHRLRVKVG